MYTLDKQAAMNADSTGKWLTETGKYVGRILCAEDIKSERTGTKGIALTLQANDGRETRQFIYTEKEDGTRLSGFDLVMALMTCLKLRDMKPVAGQVKRWDREAKQEYMEQGQVYPELANKHIGFLLQKTEEESRKTPGETAWTAKLVGVFESQTELTASEILSGKKTPEALAQRVALLADRPLKKRPAAASHSSANAYAKASNGGGADFDDSDSRGDVGHGSAEGGGQGKALSPQAKREAVVAIRQKVNISERRACRLVGLSRSVLRYEAQRDSSNEGLKARLVELAHERRRFGYRRLHLPLEREGLHANHKRVHRLYQRGWFGCAASAATPRRDGRA